MPGKYHCIRCGVSTKTPECEGCFENRRRQVVRGRRDGIVTAMAGVGVPLKYASDGMTQEWEEMTKGLDNPCRVVFGKEVNRARFAAACVRRRLMRMAEAVRPDVAEWTEGTLWRDASEAMREIRDEVNGGAVMLGAWDALAEWPFLVLHSLGDETITPWSAATMADLLRQRISNKRATVVTTGVNSGDLRNTYGDHGNSLVDLLWECDVIKVGGE